MLGLGWGEIFMIAAVALVVVGPERLPRLLRELGRYYGQARRAADELRRSFVLEADRQDAEERYSSLQSRREEAAVARKQAMKSTGGVANAGPEEPAGAAVFEGKLNEGGFTDDAFGDKEDEAGPDDGNTANANTDDDDRPADLGPNDVDPEAPHPSQVPRASEAPGEPVPPVEST